MSEPIKAGDECRVVGGAQGRHASNVGRVVIVLSLRGEHSRFGRIWRCRTKDGMPLKRIDGIFVDDGSVQSSEGDFAQAWLEKARPQGPTRDDATGIPLDSRREIVA